MKSSFVGHARRRIVGVTLGFVFAGLIALARISALGVQADAPAETPCCGPCGKIKPYAECQHELQPAGDNIVCNDETEKRRPEINKAGFCIVNSFVSDFCLFGGDESDGIKCKTEEVQPRVLALTQYLWETPGVCPANVEGKMELHTEHIALGEDCKQVRVYWASCRIDVEKCTKNGVLRDKKERPNLYRHKCKTETTNPTDPNPTDPTE